MALPANIAGFHRQKRMHVDPLPLYLLDLLSPTLSYPPSCSFLNTLERKLSMSTPQAPTCHSPVLVLSPSPHCASHWNHHSALNFPSLWPKALASCSLSLFLIFSCGKIHNIEFTILTVLSFDAPGCSHSVKESKGNRKEKR